MVAGSTQRTRNDPEKVAREKAAIDSVRDYSIEELSELLSIEQILEIDNYQTDTLTDKLLSEPFPPKISSINPLGCTALKGNTTEYDDDTEGWLAEDVTLKEIIARQEKSDQRIQALRARRSVLGFMILKNALPQTDVA